MDIKSYFSEKLGKLLFLNIESQNIYLPVNSTHIVDDIKNGRSLDSIPFTHFIYGMFFVLGADESFKYRDRYIKYLKETEGSVKYIKGKIAEEIKKDNLEEGYILLKGLAVIEKNEEVFDNLIRVLETLRLKEPAFMDEELMMLEAAKELSGYSTPYFYEAVIKNEKKDYTGALYSLNKYIELKGTSSQEIEEFRNALERDSNYKRGRELVYDDPEKALTLLIPLKEQLPDDATLYFYIGVCYRILGNYEKSIYYLNEALAIDSSLVQVVNELGINYASLGDYDTAAAYMRKAFEATKSIEICTNLVMCYLNSGRMQEALDHLAIAEKLDPKDEIVLELKDLIKKENIN